MRNAPAARGRGGIRVSEGRCPVALATSSGSAGERGCGRQIGGRRGASHWRPRGAPPPTPPRSCLAERGEFDCAWQVVERGGRQGWWPGVYPFRTRVGVEARGWYTGRVWQGAIEIFCGSIVSPSKTLRSQRPASPDARSVEPSGYDVAGERIPRSPARCLLVHLPRTAGSEHRAISTGPACRNTSGPGCTPRYTCTRKRCFRTRLRRWRSNTCRRCRGCIAPVGARQGAVRVHRPPLHPVATQIERLHRQLVQLPRQLGHRNLPSYGRPSTA
jgi:hypothetical protein